ncbi:hypothetical protein LCGC14_2746880, partial [marine sediment metagenome]
MGRRIEAEVGVGDEGPQLAVKGTDKAINYWFMSNVVNSNNALLGGNLAD